jgi:agmatinase
MTDTDELFLITGATGNTGAHTVRLLRERGLRVRALVQEQLNMVDIGDICTIPGNLEKSFFDRHVDTQELDLDERMHTTPWFHATNIPQRSGNELVQIGIGGWQAPRAGVKVGRARGTTVMTVGDVERVGVEKIVETALELAWRGAKAVYLSFDIDVIDSGFVPGIGWPEPGGLRPREALALVRGCAHGGLSGMEIVECSPPYDWAEQTSLISARVVLDSLASLVRVGKLGNKAATRRPDGWGPYPSDAPRDPSQNYPDGHYPLRREG